MTDRVDCMRILLMSVDESMPRTPLQVLLYLVLFYVQAHDSGEKDDENRPD